MLQINSAHACHDANYRCTIRYTCGSSAACLASAEWLASILLTFFSPLFHAHEHASPFEGRAVGRPKRGRTGEHEAACRGSDRGCG